MEAAGSDAFHSPRSIVSASVTPRTVSDAVRYTEDSPRAGAREAA